MADIVEMDGDGKPVREGDVIRFAFGIPPTGVEADVVLRDGKLIALTPHHNPKECRLDQLKSYVGYYYEVVPKAKNRREIEANLFAARALNGGE